MTLTANEYTKQKRSVTLVDNDVMAANGGLGYASDGGDFLLMEASRSWDVTKFTAPKKDTLEKNDLISYVVNPDGTLRVAFVSGTRTWTKPSNDNSGGESGSTCACVDGVMPNGMGGLCSDLPASQCVCGSSCGCGHRQEETL